MCIRVYIYMYTGRPQTPTDLITWWFNLILDITRIHRRQSCNHMMCKVPQSHETALPCIWWGSLVFRTHLIYTHYIYYILYMCTFIERERLLLVVYCLHGSALCFMRADCAISQGSNSSTSPASSSSSCSTTGAASDVKWVAHHRTAQNNTARRPAQIVLVIHSERMVW